MAFARVGSIGYSTIVFYPDCGRANAKSSDPCINYKLAVTLNFSLISTVEFWVKSCLQTVRVLNL